MPDYLTRDVLILISFQNARYAKREPNKVKVHILFHTTRDTFTTIKRCIKCDSKRHRYKACHSCTKSWKLWGKEKFVGDEKWGVEIRLKEHEECTTHACNWHGKHGKDRRKWIGDCCSTALALITRRTRSRIGRTSSVGRTASATAVGRTLITCSIWCCRECTSFAT